MAKNVTENHNIDTNAESYEFEDMVEGGAPADTDTKAEDEKAEVKPEKANKKGSAKGGDNVLVLKKAASYSGCGLKFTKNVPTPVEDKAIYEKLFSTGLFAKVKNVNE